MGIIRLVELLAFLMGASVLITQVIIPLFKGTSLFPFLRKERREIQSEFTEVATEAEDEAMRSDLEEFKRRLHEHATASNSTPETEVKEKSDEQNS